MTVSAGTLTKHYYDGSRRFASVLGVGFSSHPLLNNYDPLNDQVPLVSGMGYADKSLQLADLWRNHAACVGLESEIQYSYPANHERFAEGAAPGERYFYHSDASTPLSNRLGFKRVYYN